MKHSNKSSSLLLVGVGFLAPMVVAKAARIAAGRGFEKITQIEPPRNPADPEVDWDEAIIYTVCSGAIGGLAALVVRRWLAETPAISTDDESEGFLD